MEFILNTHDWPHANKWGNNMIPIFSFSKVVSKYLCLIIHYPTHQLCLYLRIIFTPLLIVNYL